MFIMGRPTLILDPYNSVIDPTTGRVTTRVAEGTPADIDRAVAAARRAFNITWGLRTPGSERGRLMKKLAELMMTNADELGALVSLENGEQCSVVIRIRPY